MDGFRIGKNVRNVRFEYFDFVTNGSLVFDDPLVVFGTASNLHFHNIRVEAPHAHGMRVGGGFDLEGPERTTSLSKTVWSMA